MARPGFATREELSRWADSVAASTELPRLIRRLILESGKGLTELKFPAAEGARVGDWDGVVRSGEATAFIPDGLSGWELSVEKNVTRKASEDYDKRIASPDGTPPATCAYVAVSLRGWKNRSQWAAERGKQGRWREVRVLGLDEVEAWLESAPVTHAWISEQLGLAPHGMATVETWWESWSTATDPAFQPELVLAGRGKEAEELRKRLTAAPQVITVAGRSRDEVIAFICAFEQVEDRSAASNLVSRTAIVDDLATWRALQDRTSPLILLAKTEQVGVDARKASSHHVIIPIVGAAQADIVLPPIDSTAATELLKAALGKSSDKDAGDLARLARVSLAAARRRSAKKPELMQPSWASRPVPRVVRRLLLAHRWNEGRDSDKELVAQLAGKAYDDVAEDVRSLSSGEDPMLTKVDEAVTVVSPHDAWILLRSEIDEGDLAAFRTYALAVLSAPDPALELEPDKRWQAGVLGKSRIHSDDLRDGVASALALLGTLGDEVLPGTATTGADAAKGIVWKLLDEANADRTGTLWSSLDDVLPSLAEAAPDEFLGGVAKGLEGEPPLLRALFANEGDGLFGRSYHTGLLWGLEVCAWSPGHFGSAVDLLGHLAAIDPGGRLANRPSSSLRSIFLPWVPQTSVNVEGRLASIDALRKRRPEVAWTLMLSCMPQVMDSSHPTYEPRYRPWKPAERPVLMREYWSFIDGLTERLISDAGDSADRWAQLAEKIDDVPVELRTKFLDQLRAIASTGSLSDKHRGRIWESLQELVGRHREFPDADWVLPSVEIERIAEVASLFEPETPLVKHKWLFADWRPPIEAVRRRNIADYDKELRRLRAEAMAEISKAASWDEIVAFGAEAKVPFAVGLALADAGLHQFEGDLLALLDSEDGRHHQVAHAYCARRAESDPDWIDRVRSSAALTPRQHARLLLATPEISDGWERAEKAGADVAHEFWRGFPMYPIKDVDHLVTAIGRLLDVGRTGVALDLLALCLPSDPDKRITELIERGLDQFLHQGGQDPEVNPQDYDYERLFEYLDKSDSVTTDRIAQLEWSFLSALEHTGRHFKIHQALADSPELFVSLLTKLYRPRLSDEEQGAEEGPAVQDEAEKPKAESAEWFHNAYRLLSGWKTVPGTREDGTFDSEKLRDWITKARQQAAAVSRRAVGDIHIGHVLAHSPADDDGLTPLIPIRDLIEETGSSDIEQGFRTEVFNSRGPTSRGLDTGGVQERALSASYAEHAVKLADRWPRTARIFKALADEYERDARRVDEDAERYRKGLETSTAVGPRPDQAPVDSDHVPYFAYGSNMSTKRIEKRLGPVKKRAIARLADYAIAFDKRSTVDGSGKTNLVKREGAEVWGVVFDLTPEQMAKLASIEKGYTEQGIAVEVDGEATPVRTFVAEERTRQLRPTREYLNLLIEGAGEHGLPDAYVQKLRRVRT